jgi:hypothetical protein
MASTTHVQGTGDVTRTDRDYGNRDVHVETPTETRRSFKTTEFFAMLAGIAAVVIAGYASDDSLDVARIWTLVTVILSAYMISRGLAKAGSHDWHGRDLGRDDR